MWARPAAGFLVFSTVVLAQVSGTITGSVVDPSGSAIPRASVNLILRGTKSAVATTVATSEGLFTLSGIRPEYYDLTIEAQGFQNYRLTNVKVDPARSTDLASIKMEIASTTTIVEVVAGAETVQTTSAALSTTVTKEQIERLPITDRDALGFISLQAGVANTAAGTFINGQRTSFSTVNYDGVNIQDNYIRSNALTYTPNLLLLDQIAEFTVTTSNPDASAAGGSQVSMASRSATNEYHGGLYWQNRNNNFAANEWFNNRDGIPLPRLNQNHLGGTLGGPILRDKFFFSVNYEAVRLRQQDSANSVILTNDARNGIFTYRDTAGVIQRRNILNIVGVRPDSEVAKLLARVPGPERINNFRTGDSTETQSLNTGGYSFLTRSNRDRDNVTGRFDYSMSPASSVTATWAWNRDLVDRPDLSGGYDAVPVVSNDNDARLLAVSWRWNPRATLTNELRGGFNFAPGYFLRRTPLPAYFATGTIFTNPESGLEPQGRDTKTWNLQDNAEWIRGRHSFKFGFQMQRVSTEVYDFFGTTPAYSLFLGFGQENFELFNSDLPRISAADLARANALLATLGGLLDSASRAYNVTSRTSGFIGGAPFARQFLFNTYALYGQDTWRIRPRLTLTLGMRWEYHSPVDERDSLALQPVVISGDPIRTLLSDATLDFAGKSIGRPWYNKDLNNFGPQIGLAWDVRGNGKTAVRLGYGAHFVNDETVRTTDAFTGVNDGLYAQLALFDLSGTLANNRPNLPAPRFQVPRLMSDNYLDNPGTYMGLVDPKLRTPYVQEWNFTIEHEIKKTIIEARYVGNHGTKMLRAVDYNQEDIRSNGFLDDFIRAQNNGNLARQRGGPFNPQFNPSIPGSQPLTVFPRLLGAGLLSHPTVIQMIDSGQAGELGFLYQVSGLNGPINFYPNPNALAANLVTNFSHSRYDSLQLEARRRLQNNLSFQVNYTFSKSLSDAVGISQFRYEPFLDLRNSKIERARTSGDLTHNFKGNFSYTLPFGTGRLDFQPLRKQIKGWTVAGILGRQSGNPFSIYSGRGTFLRSGFSGNNTANTLYTRPQLDTFFTFRQTGNGPYFVPESVIGRDGRAVAPDGQQPFSGQIFFNPGAGELGSLQRRQFTGPSVFYMDAAIMKETMITERQRVELRMEAINVFNHVTWLFGAQNNINSVNFGKITDTAVAPRVLQFALKYKF